MRILHSVEGKKGLALAIAAAGYALLAAAALRRGQTLPTEDGAFEIGAARGKTPYCEVVLK